jgi:hypothetical protein
MAGGGDVLKVVKVLKVFKDHSATCAPPDGQGAPCGPGDGGMQASAQTFAQYLAAHSQAGGGTTSSFK